MMLCCWVGKGSETVHTATTVAHPIRLESLQNCCQKIRSMFYMCVEYCRLCWLFICIMVLLAGVSDCQLDSGVY